MQAQHQQPPHTFRESPSRFRECQRRPRKSEDHPSLLSWLRLNRPFQRTYTHRVPNIVQVCSPGPRRDRMEKKGVRYLPDGTVDSCVFCRIVSGTEPNGAKILWENDTLAIFRPRDPCAEKHYLVVPKRHIQNVKSLRYEDEALVRGMGEAASRFLDALTDGTPSLSTRRFVFHVPPSNSIDHLHLHAFEGSFYKWFMRRVVYSPGTNPWCETLAKTLATRFKPPPSAL